MKIKNIFSCFALTAVFAFQLLPVKAATINKYPYFQDFEDVGEVTLTESLFDESQTALDCVFYAQGDELTVGEDNDFPEYGKVLKHISKSNKEKFILWKFPAKSSGVVSINFDLRHNDARMLYMKFSNQLWDPIIKMNDGEYTLMGSSKTGEYSRDEWYNVQIVINLDEKKKTILFNGDEFTSDFGDASVKEFYIQMQPDTEPDSEFTEILVDNLKIDAMDSIADVSLCSNEAEIKNFTGETDELYLKISDNEGDVISSAFAEDIIVTDLGDNRIVVEENNVGFETLVEAGMLKLKFDNVLKDGHRYRITLPEDTKTQYTRKLSQTEFEFNVSNDSGMRTEEKGEDFSGISELATVKRDDPIADGSLLRYFSAKSSSKTYELTEDSGCTDGVGLKLKGDRVLVMDVGDGEELKNGEYEIEARYKVISGKARISLGNDSISSGISVLETTTGENTLYKQYDNVASGLEKKYLSASNGWTVAKCTLKLDDKILEYDIDGQKGTVNMPYYDSSANQNIMTDGVGFVRFEQADKGSDYELVLDYIKIRSKTESGSVSKVIFVDSKLNSDVYIKDSYLPSDTQSIEVYFAGKVNEEGLKDIKISGVDGDESFNYSYNLSTKLCVLNLENYLKANSEYEIVIPENVTGQEIEGRVLTGDGIYEIKSIEFVDNSENKTSSISSAKKLKVSIINTLGEKKNFSMIYTSHAGFYLKNICFENIEITPDKRKAEFIMPITIDEAATKLEGFLASDINKGVLYKDYVQITK